MEKGNSNSSKALAQRLNSLSELDALASQKEAMDSIHVLDAMLTIRSFIEDIQNNTDNSVFNLNISNEDVNGWPSYQVRTEYANTEVGRLVIGAQSRRNGPVVFFRNCFLDSSVELGRNQFSNQEELSRVIRSVFREFIDEVENAVIQGRKNGLFDRSEELELADINLDEPYAKKNTSEVVAKTSAGMFSDLSLEETEDEGLSSLDLFS